MKKFLLALGLVVGLAATANAQTDVDNLQAEFLALQDKIESNAIIVQRKGPEWAVKMAKVRRLELMLERERNASNQAEQEINVIVAEQQRLQLLAAQKLQALAENMNEAEIKDFNDTYIIPVAMDMEVKKGLAMEFVEELMTQMNTFVEFPELLSDEGHVAITKYEAKILNDYLNQDETLK